MDFSALFNDPFLSDFDLQLVAGDGGEEVKRYPVHGAVLAGQSPYFKALLQNWTCASARMISVSVAGREEQDAAEMMLRCAYSGSVPQEATPEQLLACMVLADRYQLRNCVDVCRRAIHAVDSVRVSWPTTLALLHLPPGLQEVDAFSSLAEKAYQRVWADFHNLDVAFQRAHLRAAFLQLPRGAVEHLLGAKELRTVSENVAYLAVASWLRARHRDAGGGGAAAPAAAAAAAGAAAAGAVAAAACGGGQAGCGGGGQAGAARGAEGSGGGAAVAAAVSDADALHLLRLVRYPHMSANFFNAVASHDSMLRRHPDFQMFLLEASQYAMASEQQRVAMQGDPRCGRLVPRTRSGEAPTSAFTSYIARDDLHTAISKYRASSCRDAYYLLTEGHCWNGFTWRLKLTVKPPDPEAGVEMNIHVGLCWSVEIAGEPLPLGESSVVAVEFSIATHDFTMHEDDPTHSDSPVLIRAGTCWGWDDFFGREAYADLDGEFSKWMNEKGQMPLTCHLYSCG